MNVGRAHLNRWVERALGAGDHGVRQAWRRFRLAGVLGVLAGLGCLAIAANGWLHQRAVDERGIAASATVIGSRGSFKSVSELEVVFVALEGDRVQTWVERKGLRVPTDGRIEVRFDPEDPSNADPVGGSRSWRSERGVVLQLLLVVGGPLFIVAGVDEIRRPAGTRARQ